MRDQSFHEANVELHRRWTRLCSTTPANKREADSLKRRQSRLKDEVITTNDRMLWRAVQQFSHSGTTEGVDLYSVAAIKLWEVFQVWDPERSTLATAAKLHISGAVRREVAQNEFPGLSYDQWTLRGNLLKTAKQIQETSGHQPGFEEIAAAASVPTDTVELLLTARESSLDAPVGGSDDPDSTTLGELLPEEAYEHGAEEPDGVIERDTPRMLAGQDPVDAVRYLLGSKASMYRMSHTAVGLLTGGSTRTVHASVAAASMEIAVRQIEDLIQRLPTSGELAAAVKVPEPTAAAFLSQRDDDILEDDPGPE